MPATKEQEPLPTDIFFIMPERVDALLRCANTDDMRHYDVRAIERAFAETRADYDISLQRRLFCRANRD